MRRILAIITLTIGLALLIPATSFAAYSIVDGIDCGAHPEAAACHVDKNINGEDPITGPAGLLVDIARIVSYVAGAAAIILIIVAAIRFVTSGGNAENVKKARDTILYAMVGVAVVVLARVMIFFVLSFYK